MSWNQHPPHAPSSHLRLGSITCDFEVETLAAFCSIGTTFTVRSLSHISHCLKGVQQSIFLTVQWGCETTTESAPCHWRPPRSDMSLLRPMENLNLNHVLWWRITHLGPVGSWMSIRQDLMTQRLWACDKPSQTGSDGIRVGETRNIEESKLPRPCWSSGC